MTSTFSPYKRIGTQIWSCCKKVKGQLKIITWKQLGRPWSVPDDIYQDSALKLSWFWRRRFLSVFTTYGHGCRLKTMTIWTNFQHPPRPPFNRRLRMKFEENLPRSFRKVIQRCGRTMTDSKWSQYWIAWLRWAKKRMTALEWRKYPLPHLLQV